ncbi:hypothetical protein GCM10011391_39430 [Pullulanibacillus camelliae]|uniref:VTT domain-containing protein n=1 Tax=Pullulanibacillus camelliae TaxID=1707096 RepID=A0A8J3E141_9BACL|nr:VTT domain-containing protein [Pullulanibacillus camelliae]GGE56642.1 hypothetical protein GCM10011391_39430 [Pullulanibacillus camelliae]
MTALMHLLDQYGYIVIFFSLMLELIILPIPNEALMSYVGVLSFQGKMNIILATFFAGCGAAVGATVSYWIGYKLGAPFFKKYGHYIHMGPEKMETMEKWYKKYGKILLIFSFFIPGVRHIASIISGVIKLPVRQFMVFSYIGLFSWVSTFIFLGYTLGPKWEEYEGEIKKWLVLASILIGMVVLCYFVLKANRRYLKEALWLIFDATFKRFKSFLKIKLLILTILALFVTFFTLMVGMVQDFISNEFVHFNTIVGTIVFSLFNPHWQGIMNGIYHLSSWLVLGIIALLTVIGIVVNRKHIGLELLFFFITLIGVFVFSKGIHWLFQFLFQGAHISSDFPNAPSMYLLCTLGYFLFMLIRHHRNYQFSVMTTLFFVIILAAYFISGTYGHVLPSDLIAGYVFSAVWICGMFLALETFRFLSILKKEDK